MPELPDDLIDDPATFETMTGPKVTVPVHFNPASLQHTVSNTLKEEGKGAKKKQYVSQTTAKLTMDLTFDTTDSGEDVRITTNKMAQLLQPVPEGQSKKVPPVVKFSWGAYSFTGMVEQYKETIDFFAAGGLPLRSSINLTLSSQDVSFEGGTSSEHASVDADLAPEPVVLADDEGPAGGPQGAASRAGDPRAARAIAAANGSASLRFGAGAGLAVGASASVGFSAGASVGAGFSAGIGGSAGGGSNLLPAAAFAAGGGGGSRDRGGRGREHWRWCWCWDRNRNRRWSIGRARWGCRAVGRCRVFRSAGRECCEFATAVRQQSVTGLGEHFQRWQGRAGRADHRRRWQRPQGQCGGRGRVRHRRALRKREAGNADHD